MTTGDPPIRWQPLPVPWGMWSDEPTQELPTLHPPYLGRLLFGGIGAGVLLIGGLLLASAATTDHRPAPPDRSVATLELVGDATDITVRTADLGDDLYRVNQPARAARDGDRIRVDVADGGRVELLLAQRVSWDLGVRGSAGTKRIDLAAGRFRAVDLSGGTGHVDLTLPPPDGTLTVRLTDGVNRFDVHTTGGAPVRVRVGSGAGNVVLPDQAHAGVAAGALFTPDRWNDATDRIDLDAAAGMSRLTVSGTG